VTVVLVLTCCCVPNFIKIGSRVRPPDAHNCRMFTVARQRPSPWQPNRGGQVGDMMGCDHPSWVSVGLLVGELWHFYYFRTWRLSAILNFKNFNIWSRECHCGPNLLLYTKFHQNWFTRSPSRRPWLHNVQCSVARQRPSPWKPHHSGHVGHMMGCDQPSFCPSRSIGRRVMSFRIFSNMAAVRHFEFLKF